MSFTVHLSMPNPLSYAVCGHNSTQRGAIQHGMVMEDLERLGMADTFFEGTFPEHGETQAFLAAWLPEALERINQSASEQLQLNCPSCGRAVPLQLVADDQLQTNLPTQAQYDDPVSESQWNWFVDCIIEVQAAALPDSCPDEACGHQFQDGDAPGSLGEFEYVLAPDQQRQLEELQQKYQQDRASGLPSRHALYGEWSHLDGPSPLAQALGEQPQRPTE